MTPSAGAACRRTSPRGSSCLGSTSPRRRHAAQFSTPDPTAVWQLGVDTGRAYAAVSGDFNPIHLSVLSAKALGLRRSIAHGMYLASRALADVGAAKGEAFRWDVAFEAPVFLPARVALDITTDQDHGGLAALGLRGLERAFRPQALQRVGGGAVARSRLANTDDGGGGTREGLPPPSDAVVILVSGPGSGLSGFTTRSMRCRLNRIDSDRAGGVSRGVLGSRPPGQFLDGGVGRGQLELPFRAFLFHGLSTSPTADIASARGSRRTRPAQRRGCPRPR